MSYEVIKVVILFVMYFNFRFSKCGGSLIVGFANGKTTLCSLDDMPFPPHFQFAALEGALHESLSAQPKLLEQIKSLRKELSY